MNFITLVDTQNKVKGLKLGFKLNNINYQVKATSFIELSEQELKELKTDLYKTMIGYKNDLIKEQEKKEQKQRFKDMLKKYTNKDYLTFNQMKNMLSDLKGFKPVYMFDLLSCIEVLPTKKGLKCIDDFNNVTYLYNDYDFYIDGFIF